MNAICFSNGVIVDSSKIVCIESSQQTITFPGGIGEVEHLLKGRPSALVIHLRDSSVVEIKAGQSILTIHINEVVT